MSEEIKKNEMDMELSLDNLEEVSGGGLLADLLARIKQSGKAPEYKRIFTTEGKAAAVAVC